MPITYFHPVESFGSCAEAVENAHAALAALVELTEAAIGSDAVDLREKGWGYFLLAQAPLERIEKAAEWMRAQQAASEEREVKAFRAFSSASSDTPAKATERPDVEALRKTVMESAVGSGLGFEEIGAAMNVPAETVKRIVTQLQGGAATSLPEPERKAG